jgi:hypothetical protein
VDMLGGARQQRPLDPLFNTRLQRTSAMSLGAKAQKEVVKEGTRLAAEFVEVYNLYRFEYNMTGTISPETLERRRRLEKRWERLNK